MRSLAARLNETVKEEDIITTFTKLNSIRTAPLKALPNDDMIMCLKSSKFAAFLVLTTFGFATFNVPSADAFIFRPASAPRAKKTALSYTDYPSHVLATRSELADEARKLKMLDLPLVVVANSNPTKLRLDIEKMTTTKKKKTEPESGSNPKKWVSSTTDVEKHYVSKQLQPKEFAHRLLGETHLYLMNDPVVRHLLGPPVEITFKSDESTGTHHSSSGRRMIRVRGKSTIGLEFKFKVQGSRASGVVVVTATLEDGIVKMNLHLGKDPQERIIPVTLSASKISSKSPSAHQKRSVRIVRDYNENVVRAEIVKDVEEEEEEVSQ